ncbi:hypothetical protein ASPVEDRAFT_36831 [Aspergillus versicolor CBS 583.65]|uniref:Uncharacterized protein n=1 Tax=Aspergillus versicolor CBS 583.65 TaxID=1036611 RepID=A0A1L9P7A7_ASPVE|nr:uncharacterized protein ASPVEDRAFT_36831 [Aspergillus versicolor CBS 583.65]OJI97420.1 hypothetical protein ASPVEDRAFT_36831 [Aspergillus versicolor CBS 583.65]
MFGILDFSESNDKSQLKQLTKPARPRIPLQQPPNNAFATASATVPTRAQIGWPDSSDTYDTLPTNRKTIAQKAHEQGFESRRLPILKRLDGPRTERQPEDQQPQAHPRRQFLTEPQSANAAGSRSVDDFENHEREHRQPTYYHRHKRPRANVGVPRYHSPPHLRRNQTDRSRGHSSRDKKYSMMKDRHKYIESPEPDYYTHERGRQKIPHPREDPRRDPEPQLQSQPTRTKESKRHRNHLVLRKIMQEEQQRRERQARWEEETLEAKRLERELSFAETQRMRAEREAKNAARIAELKRLQRLIADENRRGKIEGEVHSEDEETAMKHATVDQYQLEEKEELWDRKLEKLEIEFCKKIQIELDNLLDHVKGLILAHDEVEVGEEVDVAHVDEVTPTELSARSSVRKSPKTEVKEKKL